MSELAGLIERVEAATGPDHILDAAIARDIAGLCLHGSWHSEGPEGDRGRVCDDCGADSWGNLGKHGQRLNAPLPAYTASIDAAVSVAESVAHIHGRKLICFFCAGGQLMPHNADREDTDYHPLAKIDNSVTVGWLSHVAFFKPDGGSETYGPESYSHGANAALAIVLALLRALAHREPTNGR